MTSVIYIKSTVQFPLLESVLTISPSYNRYHDQINQFNYVYLIGD